MRLFLHLMMPRLLVGGCDVMQNYEKKQGYVDKFVNKLLKLKKLERKLLWYALTLVVRFVADLLRRKLYNKST